MHLYASTTCGRELIGLDTQNDRIELLSITQAAKELKVGRKRIHEMIEKSEIGVIEFENGTVRIPYPELRKWVQEKTTYASLRKLPMMVNLSERVLLLMFNRL
ncbi:MAG: helix-turn-helix domain-containing protein [Ignavibacteria bacterium]|nr:helix-turn-helix domain-containing protein [Ignavibacteria bacterium]